MTDNEFFIRLFTLALLLGFLAYKQWERARQREAVRREIQHECTPMDLRKLQPRVHVVQELFPASARMHARGIGAREELVAMARRSLRHLPFFRHGDEELEKH